MCLHNGCFAFHGADWLCLLSGCFASHGANWGLLPTFDVGATHPCLASAQTLACTEPNVAVVSPSFVHGANMHAVYQFGFTMWYASPKTHNKNTRKWIHPNGLLC
jgi:hypothetical protein